MNTKLYTLRKGNTLQNGKYVIEGLLGRGGFGITYLANFSALDRKVAIKEFFPSGYTRLPDFTVSAEPTTKDKFTVFKEKFLDEARLIARFDQEPHIVNVSDFFEENNTVYYVMELLEGMNLKEYVKAKGGKLSEDEAVDFTIQIGNALALVHQEGLLHRDIKPSNIMLRDNGMAVLIDFGSAREYVQQQTMEHTVIVSAGYAPPEQYDAHEQRGPYSDVYALGGTLYYLLTGIAPLAATRRLLGNPLTPPKQLNSEVSEPVNHAVMKALYLQMDARYQSMSDFVTDLLKTDVIEDTNSQTYPYSERKQQADGHFFKKEYALAAKIYQELLRYNPNDLYAKQRLRACQNAFSDHQQTVAPSKWRNLAWLMPLVLFLFMGTILYVGGKFLEKEEVVTTNTELDSLQAILVARQQDSILQAKMKAIVDSMIDVREKEAFGTTPDPNKPQPDIPITTPAEAQKIETVFKEAEEAIKKGDYKKAEAEFQKIKGMADKDPHLKKQLEILEELIEKAQPKPLPTPLPTPPKVSTKPKTTEQLYIETVKVEGGKFKMGQDNPNVGCANCSADEQPVHKVKIETFEISKFEVNQALWKKVMGEHPSNFKNCDNCPVENVNWKEVQGFIKKLNELTGENYRLPTESEWEYVARGGVEGTSGKYNFQYSGNNKLSEVGWYGNNSGSKTHPRGNKLPNQLGVYDMSGNVAEWVQDCWHSTYKRAPGDGSAWLDSHSGQCDKRVLRGGSWSSTQNDCRVTNRLRTFSDVRKSNFGFRLAK